MNYNDDDQVLEDLFSTIPEYDTGWENGGQSPSFEGMETLQVPMHDEPVTSYDMEYSQYNDSSLSVPMRDFAPDPPRLSPATLPSYQMHGYEMSHDINSQGYNSFEQPVAVINSEQTYPVEEVQLQSVDTHYSYSDEVATTSNHQPNPPSSSRGSATRSQPPPRQPNTSASRNRPIQPKSSNSNRRKTVEPKSNTQEVRVSQESNQRIAQIMVEIQVLQDQQAHNMGDNTDRLNELQLELLTIFNMPKDVIQATPPSKPAPARPSRPSGGHGQARRQPAPPPQYIEEPSSPVYQPQLAMMTPNSNQPQIYSDYAQPQQIVMQTHAPTHQQPHQPQGQVVRIVGHVNQQHVQMTGQQGQQVVYVQTSSSGSQQFITPPSSQPQTRTYISTQPQPIQPKPQMQRVVLKPPHTMASTTQSFIIPRGQTQVPHHLPQHHVVQAHQAPPPQVQHVYIRPPKQSAQHLAQAAAERKLSRQARVRDCLSALHHSVEHPDTERPFKDLGDVIKRLVGFHSLTEPDLQQEQLDEFDANLLRTNINQGAQVAELKSKILKVLYDESQVVSPPEEQNLLLYLDMEYEKRKLEEEKELVLVDDYNRADFVRSSNLIPGLRGTHMPALEPLASPLKLQNTYEYYPFEEEHTMVSPCKSPYIMSPTTSNRSQSPIKTPAFHSPRLRQRSVASYEEDHIDVKPAFNAADKKTVAERRTAEKKAQEVAKEQTKTVNIKPERTDSGYDRPFKPVSPQKPKAASKPAAGKIKVKLESEPVPSTSYEPPKGLPSKKMFLNRARNEAPPALRSPPALMMRPPSSTARTNGMDSDGSASPELGEFGDNYPPPRALVIPPPPAGLSSIKSEPLKKLAPLPAPQPKKEATVPTVGKIIIKNEASKSFIKAEDSKKSAFKTELPKSESVTHSPANGTAVHAPIRLRLKLGGNVSTLTIGPTNEKENKHKDDDERKRRKEKKKKRNEERERRREERKREKEMDTTAEEVKEEYVAIPTGGLKIKLKRNYSRTNTPAIPTESETPSTSKVNGSFSQQETPPLKVPKLKIKLGLPPAERRVEVAEVVAPVSRSMPKPMNGQSIFNVNITAQGALPPVTFSDESDGDDDLKRATDETMRSWGMFSQTPTIPAFPATRQ